MGNAKEKFLVLLQLLNNCREKFYSLCNLSATTLRTAEQNNNEMGMLHEDIMSCHDEMKVTIKSGKTSKLFVKSIKTKLNENTEKFLYLYDEFCSLFDDIKALYKQYKQEVQSCCNAYNQMNGDSIPEIKKGYRTQVNLIQKIKAKTKEYIERYKQLSEVANNRKVSFTNTCDKVNSLATSV